MGETAASKLTMQTHTSHFSLMLQMCFKHIQPTGGGKKPPKQLNIGTPVADISGLRPFCPLANLLLLSPFC